MTHDFLTSIERPFRALRYRRARKRHAALTPAAERFAPPLPPVTLTAADLPAGPGSILLRDESALLAEISRSAARIPHTQAIAFEGVNIADFLRKRIPAASDAELARIVLCSMFVTRHMFSAEDDPVAAMGALWESLGAAAMHLTEMERVSAP